MSKRRATPETVEAFIKAVYPEATELQAAFSSEGACLSDATELINDLRRQLVEVARVSKAYADDCESLREELEDSNAQLIAASIREARLRGACLPLLDSKNITGAEEFVVVSLTPEEWRAIRAALAAPDSAPSPVSLAIDNARLREALKGVLDMATVYCHDEGTKDDLAKIEQAEAALAAAPDDGVGDGMEVKRYWWSQWKPVIDVLKAEGLIATAERVCEIRDSMLDALLREMGAKS